MDYTEILEIIITELTEQIQKQQRSEDTEVDKLVLKRIQLSQQVQEYISYLSKDAQNVLEEYHRTIDALSDHQLKYLYVQGAKDCVALLRELGVIR